jgi:hypothetical protein
MNKKDTLFNLKLWLKTQSDNTDFSIYTSDSMFQITTPKEYEGEST